MAKNLKQDPKGKTVKKTKSATWYKEGAYKKDYDESSFKDDIDRNKQPYPKDADMINTKSKSTAVHKTFGATKKTKMRNGGAMYGSSMSSPMMKYGGQNSVAKISKSATVKSSSAGGVNTPPKKAIPMKKMGGMKSKKSC